jgi:hypothetical protein
VFQTFAFCLTPLDVTFSTPAQVLPGYTFTKPDADQLAAIKELLTSLGAQSFKQFYQYRWTYRPKNKGFSADLLPEAEWKYWILQFHGKEHVTPELLIALHLLEPAIEIGFEVSWDVATKMKGYGWTCARANVFSYFDGGAFTAQTALREITLDHWAPAKDLIRLLYICQTTHPTLWRVINDFEASKALPRSSSMRVLSLFSVLEALITHKQSGPQDGITKQIKAKMNFLGKRFHTPLDYSTFPLCETPEEAWKELYTFRSIVAHGGTLDFARKELKRLVSREQATAFLEIAVCRLLRFTLVNPDFVADLQKC